MVRARRADEAAPGRLGRRPRRHEQLLLRRDRPAPAGHRGRRRVFPVIGLAALSARTRRNALALVVAVAGVYLLTDVRLVAEPVGVAFAVANAVLFASYIVLAHRVAQSEQVQGIDALAAGIGVGVSSSVIPYACDQLAMARLPRATYALMVSLLPATATVIGIVVLTQIPTPVEIVGVALVIAGVAIHQARNAEAHPEPGSGQHVY